jgi:hypothetical protein
VLVLLGPLALVVLTILAILTIPPFPWVFVLGPACIQMVPVLVIWLWWYACRWVNGTRAVAVASRTSDGNT